jgi:hypothetical protein
VRGLSGLKAKSRAMGMFYARQAFFVCLAKQVTASMLVVEERGVDPRKSGARLREVLDDPADLLTSVRSPDSRAIWPFTGHRSIRTPLLNYLLV